MGIYKIEEDLKTQSIFKRQIGTLCYFQTLFVRKNTSIPMWRWYNDSGVCIGWSIFKNITPDYANRPHGNT